MKTTTYQETGNESTINEKVFFVSFVRYGEVTEDLHVTLDSLDSELYLADIHTLFKGLQAEYEKPYTLMNEIPNLDAFRSAEFLEALKKVTKHSVLFSQVFIRLVEQYATSRKTELVIDNIFYDGFENSNFVAANDSCFGFFLEGSEESSFVSFGQMELGAYQDYISNIQQKDNHTKYFPKQIQ